METIYLGIVIFLIVLAIFDLVVGVSNDAVNFLNSAVGAKVANFKIIIAVASVGIFAGAAMSNGMMDVARHGIFAPQFFTFYDVMCIFLAVMVTDVIILDVFNSLGMPTSTTVSMVFELLGGAFALSIVKVAQGATAANGELLTLGHLLNSDKALSVIIAIFVSVAIAFVFGIIVQWISRICFTFTYRNNGGWRTVVFASIATTSIIWFLLINGMKGSSIMTPELHDFISTNKLRIIAACFLASSIVMTILSLLRINALRIIVLLGTFALAMAFAGNDLVNFIGVPLSGLDSYNSYMENGGGSPDSLLMTSLSSSAQTPVLYLIIAGVIMILSLIFSKKAHNVVKTSVDLSRQDEGDEMFGSSSIARIMVRSSSHTASTISQLIPQGIKRWTESRFNTFEAVLPQGAAFDLIRASVNLVLAGLLVAIGTSMKLPLSTTYVTFMVAMGTSLADRAWGRESAVFRITGVISVIGGWFITAGAAFLLCSLVVTLMYFGGSIVMGILIVVTIVLIVRSNVGHETKKTNDNDTLFQQIIHSQDKTHNWQLLHQHICQNNASRLDFTIDCFVRMTDAFFNEEYRQLKRCNNEIESERKEHKRQRRREILGLRHTDIITATTHNTWFFLANNSSAQLLYCLKRINDPCMEHVGNNFHPVPLEYSAYFRTLRAGMIRLFERASKAITTHNTTEYACIRSDSHQFQAVLSGYRQSLIDDIQAKQNLNIEAMTLFLSIVQESQEMLSSLRHMLRGMMKMQ